MESRRINYRGTLFLVTDNDFEEKISYDRAVEIAKQHNTIDKNSTKHDFKFIQNQTFNAVGILIEDKEICTVVTQGWASECLPAQFNTTKKSPRTTFRP